MDIEALWKWAEQHHGLVRDDELREAGVSRRRRGDLERLGLERMSPRVLRRLGAPRSQHQEALAAALDGGKGVALARASGSWLWDVPGFALGCPVDLTRERATSSIKRSTLGVIRTRRSLPAHHVTTVAGIPVLTLPVLLYELAGVLHPQRFERAADTVVGRSPAVLRSMHDLLPELAARGRNGISAVRAYLEERPAGQRTPTGLERKFERTFEDAGQRAPRRQVDLGGHEWLGRVDYYDRDVTLLIEIQSKTFHSSLLDRRADDLRVEELLAAGFRAALLIPEELVWYRSRDVLECVRLARLAANAPEPARFVTAIRALGARIAVTKRGLAEDVVQGEGRMGA